ncbi:MAG: hypothetical protein D6791_18355 [Chloroflexi bacterium]|nr:MAG: hypothetical protein D6791_18355 [Chloroflexota bacterium]
MSEHQTLSAEVRFLIDFNVQNVPALLGLDVPDVAAAAMFDVPAGALSAYIREIEDAVQETAAELLGDPLLARALAGWSLPQGATVLAIGDSITTYRYSFARLLAAMLEQQRGKGTVRFVNMAQSGFTSSQGLETTFTQFLAHDPDWVFIKFGVNDAKLFGGTDARTLVTRREYRANLSAILDAFSRYTRAQVVLLTPTPVVEDITDSFPDFQAVRLYWRNTILALFAEEVQALARDRSLPCVDLFSLLGPAPNPAWYLPDGLHPNAEGHRLILREVLKVLAGL